MKMKMMEKMRIIMELRNSYIIFLPFYKNLFFFSSLISLFL